MAAWSLSESSCRCLPERESDTLIGLICILLKAGDFYRLFQNSTHSGNSGVSLCRCAGIFICSDPAFILRSLHRAIYRPETPDGDNGAADAGMAKEFLRADGLIKSIQHQCVQCGRLDPCFHIFICTRSFALSPYAAFLRIFLAFAGERKYHLLQESCAESAIKTRLFYEECGGLDGGFPPRRP